MPAAAVLVELCLDTEGQEQALDLDEQLEDVESRPTYWSCGESTTVRRP
jgi:hypothetical protein